jgi:3-dehydroquinate dehydratase
MGFFSPGFVIGAASSLTNQIEDAKERNADMMERRRDQFDQLSREAKQRTKPKKDDRATIR